MNSITFKNHIRLLEKLIFKNSIKQVKAVKTEMLDRGAEMNTGIIFGSYLVCENSKMFHKSPSGNRARVEGSGSASRIGKTCSEILH